MPPTPPTPHVVASIGDMLIGVQADPLVVSGQQWIFLTHRPTGQPLADFLTVDWKLTSDLQWIVLPHTPDVDHRLKKLIDACAAIRLNAPHLVQLELIVSSDQIPPAPLD